MEQILEGLLDALADKVAERIQVVGKTEKLFLTVQEATQKEWLDCCENTVYEGIIQGRIPAIQLTINGTYRIPVPALMEMLRNPKEAK